MKKIHALLPITIVSLFLLFASCKKGNVPGPVDPNVTLPTSGHLVCIGRDRDNQMDTLTFWHTTIAREMTEFYREFLRPADEIRFIPNGNGTVRIRRKEPHVHDNFNYDKFGIEENTNAVFSSFPNNKYLWTMYQKDESVLNTFIINRDPGDMKKFTIESKAFPGYYMGVEKWKNAVYPTTDRLVFTTKPVTWWFEQR